MAQRTENNPPFGYKFNSKVVQDLTELYAMSGGDSDYKVVACVLRNTGSGWFAINDVDHEPLNITSVSNDNTQIILDYSGINATKVVSLVVAPDETYAGLYDFGSSVGLDSSSIRISRREKQKVVSLITHTGNGNFTRSGSDVTGVTYSNTTGLLTINHVTCNGVDPQTCDLPSTDANNTLLMNSGTSAGTTSTKFKLYNLDGTQKNLSNPEVSRFYFNRSIENELLNKATINPNNVAESLGNIWVYGIMKVS